ncbi:MAG: L-threonylcarbamoyladenylate synthase [Rhodoferax sp.]
MILDGLDAKSIAAGAACIRSGGLLGIPTETVYGLAADADNALAVGKIFAAKGRPAAHPLIVHVLDAASASHFAADVPEFGRRLMQAFWPGPLTLILPRRAGVAAAAAGGQDSIGLRCPSHPAAQALLQACRDAGDDPTHPQAAVWGLAAPSANQFGRVSPTTAKHVQSEFGADLLILDGGACAVGIESTIIDCTRGVPVLLRPGAVTREQARQVCGQPVFSMQEFVGSSASMPRASGTLASHYAPLAKVRLMDAQEMQKALDLLGGDLAQTKGLQPAIATYARALLKNRSSLVLSRRMPDDAAATAQQLFAVLREFDDQGVRLIWIETPPPGPDWDGVRDRLQRAAAG